MFSKQLYSLSLFLCFELCFGDRVDVNTTSGLVIGETFHVLNKSINQFLAIPYAKPPTGGLRFKKPEPIEKPLEGVINVNKFGHSCLEPVEPRGIIMANQSEDCLLLNIWSPESDDKNSTQLKPVMFWIHGGGLVFGSVFLKQYNGTALAGHGVVLVTINYRLNAFGFLYSGDESAPGNVGLYDQLLALKWVRENIHLFGGDKDQITIFGQSAGGWSTSSLLLSPLAEGLFKRAIVESGANLFNKERDVFSKEEVLLVSKAIAKSVNCTDSKEWLECLRRVDAKDIINSEFMYTVFTFPLSGTEYLPFPSHKAFEELKFNRGLDIMAGVSETEGSFLASINFDIFKEKKNFSENDFKYLINGCNSEFHNIDVQNVTEFYLRDVNTNSSDALVWAFGQFWGDLLITCPTYKFAKYYGKYSPKSSVYFYVQTYQRTGKYPGMGVTHGAEIDFTYGLPLILKEKSDTKTDIDFSKEMMKMWTNFAKNGKPNTNWPQLINTGDENPVPKIQELNPNKMNHIFENLFHETCDGIWDKYF